jgi:hypothetical protein
LEVLVSPAAFATPHLALLAQVFAAVLVDTHKLPLQQRGWQVSEQ